MRLCVLALCAIGVVSGTETGSKETVNRQRRSSGTEVFLNFAGEPPSDESNHNAPVFPAQLPNQLGGQDRVTIPQLVVPVPVSTDKQDLGSARHDVPKPAEPTQALLQINIPHAQIHDQTTQQDVSAKPVEINLPLPSEPYLRLQDKYGQALTKIIKFKSGIHVSQEPLQTYTQFKFQGHDQVSKLDDAEIEKPSDLKKVRQPDSGLSFQRIFVPAPVFNIYAPSGSLSLNVGLGGHKVSFEVNGQESNTLVKEGNNADASVSIDVGKEKEQKEINTPVTVYEKTPFSDGSPIFETSEQMIQSFLRQSPVAPHLPAVMPNLPFPDRLQVLEPASVDSPPIPADSPPRPDFNRSLHLRVDLAVPSSDYTEAYDIQWHAESNTARTEIEDGSTIIYRKPEADGRIKFIEVRLYRNSGKDYRLCTISPLMPVSPAFKSFPGLPAFDQFEFNGYTSAEGRSLVERWRRVVTGGPGEGGAAEGESLTFTHEMLIIRDGGQAVPLRYTVVTDSSVLGPASDSYTHRYRQLAAPTAAVLPKVSRDCDDLNNFPDDDNDSHDLEEKHLQEDIESLLPRVVSRFDPISEFARPMRDARYDSILTKFNKQFKRKYLDSAEEAVRKTLLIRSTRFIEAGNRLGSGFKMAANFLADRLDDEIHQLFGVQAPPEGASDPGLVPFPYSDDDLKKVSNELGNDFDWRQLGAVSPVRFQETTCSSSYAFAVAGSTEGALFKKTNKLVPLSPQVLLDCGKPFGMNGCNGSWPGFAYDYVQARGLPSWEEYEYDAKVLRCQDNNIRMGPVTHISGHVNVTAFSETALKMAIKNHAPNVVIVDAKAKSFLYYKSGVLKDKRCGQNIPRLNHAVLAVGWGTGESLHFIIKNSWSTKWGEEGYMRTAPDTCAVLERPSYPLIEERNIDMIELHRAATNLKA